MGNDERGKKKIRRKWQRKVKVEKIGGKRDFFWNTIASS